MSNEIGNRIKTLMEKENVSPQSFAKEIGITLGGLNHILTGRNKPRYDMLLKIVGKYKDISLEWLILGNLPIYRKEKATFFSAKESTSFDVNYQNSHQMKRRMDESENVKERTTTNKSEKLPIESSKIQSFVEEFSISESIEEIRVYFKNKTFLVLKPEK